MKIEPQVKAAEMGRRSPRVETQFLVLLRCSTGKFPARITNLSASGFRLEAPQPLEAGWEITLQAPRRAPVKCLVRWVSGKEAGGIFLEPASM